jgi:hypothetical protein
MDPKTWTDRFKQYNKAAKEGRYLPSLHDLYCGMSFFGGSVAADAQEWSKHIVPDLAQKGQEMPRNPVQIAYERLMVSARLEDLQSVYEEISEYRIPLEMLGEILRADRRMVFYRVALGDESVCRCLMYDLFYTIRLLSDSATDFDGIDIY